jgi:hypothetical protein
MSTHLTILTGIVLFSLWLGSKPVISAPKQTSSPLWPSLVPPSPDPVVDLINQIPLLPDPDMARQVEIDFKENVAFLNQQIADHQTRLHSLLLNWSSDPSVIREIQAQLSELRTERDRLALEHLLILRQLERDFALPRSTTGDSSASP